MNLKLKETEKQLLQALDHRRVVLVQQRRPSDPSKGLSVVSDLLGQFQTQIEDQLEKETLQQELCKALRLRATLLQQMVECINTEDESAKLETIEKQLHECEHNISDLTRLNEAKTQSNETIVNADHLLETLVSDGDRNAGCGGCGSIMIGISCHDALHGLFPFINVAEVCRKRIESSAVRDRYPSKLRCRTDTLCPLRNAMTSQAGHSPVTRYLHWSLPI